MSKITLQCVKDRGKLRIRFFSFTNEEGTVFTNVYNNTYNCKFPRKIRKEGLFYEIGANDIKLVSSNNRVPFYSIKKNNIKIINNIDISKIKIFEVKECVVCMAEDTSEIFIPCGHLCTCHTCCSLLSKMNNKCPLCRRIVTDTITKQV